MIIANDVERKEFIHSAPDSPVPLSYILTDLWPKLGFLPIDPENPGVALIAEFMLNELILKNSDSLDKLNLQQLKELFSGADDMEMEDEMGDDDYEQDDFNQVPQQQKELQQDGNSDNYSSDDKEDPRFMDINDLKNRQGGGQAKAGDSDSYSDK